MHAKRLHSLKHIQKPPVEIPQTGRISCVYLKIRLKNAHVYAIPRRRRGMAYTVVKRFFRLIDYTIHDCPCPARYQNRCKEIFYGLASRLRRGRKTVNSLCCFAVVPLCKIRGHSFSGGLLIRKMSVSPIFSGSQYMKCAYIYLAAINASICFCNSSSTFSTPAAFLSAISLSTAAL